MKRCLGVGGCVHGQRRMKAEHRGRQMNERMCGWMIDGETERKMRSEWRMTAGDVDERMDGWIEDG